MNWEASTKHFLQYPKGKTVPTEEGNQGMNEFHHRGKRRASHHSSDHDLEVVLSLFSKLVVNALNHLNVIQIGRASCRERV